MTRRVFLHIGAMKTGTTSLQHRLFANQARLRRAGILVPGGSLQGQAAAFGDLLAARRVMPGGEGAWQRLRRELRGWDGDAILSMELLAARGPAQIARVARRLGPVELHIILTARDLARAIPSQWQETTQNGGTVGWRDYVDAVCSDEQHTPAARKFWRQQDIAEILRRWSQVAPLDQMHLVTVPPSGGDPSVLWARVTSVMGLEADRYPTRGRPINSSLGAVSAELMRRVSAEVEGLDWPQYRTGFKSGLAKRTLALRASAEPRLALPERHHEWVRQRAKRMITEIEELSPSVVGDLGDLLPTAQLPDSETDPGHTSEAELLDAAIVGLVGLGTQLATARLELARLTAADKTGPPAGQVQDKGAAVEERLDIGRKAEAVGTPASSWVKRLVRYGRRIVRRARRQFVRR